MQIPTRKAIEMHKIRKDTHKLYKVGGLSPLILSNQTTEKRCLIINREELTDNVLELKQFANMHYVPFNVNNNNL